MITYIACILILSLFVCTRIDRYRDAREADALLASSRKVSPTARLSRPAGNIRHRAYPGRMVRA